MEGVMGGALEASMGAGEACDLRLSQLSARLASTRARSRAFRARAQRRAAARRSAAPRGLVLEDAPGPWCLAFLNAKPSWRKDDDAEGCVENDICAML